MDVETVDKLIYAFQAHGKLDKYWAERFRNAGKEAEAKGEDAAYYTWMMASYFLQYMLDTGNFPPGSDDEDDGGKWECLIKDLHR